MNGCEISNSKQETDRSLLNLIEKGQSPSIWGKKHFANVRTSLPWTSAKRFHTIDTVSWKMEEYKPILFLLCHKLCFRSQCSYDLNSLASKKCQCKSHCGGNYKSKCWLHRLRTKLYEHSEIFNLSLITSISNIMLTWSQSHCFSVLSQGPIISSTK